MEGDKKYSEKRKERRVAYSRSKRSAGAEEAKAAIADQDEPKCIVCHGLLGTSITSVCGLSGHSIHTYCALKWTRQKRACPHCRQPENSVSNDPEALSRIIEANSAVRKSLSSSYAQHAFDFYTKKEDQEQTAKAEQFQQEVGVFHLGGTNMSVYIYIYASV